MIDKGLLKKLGWSEDLINEVTRISGDIIDVIGENYKLEDPAMRDSSSTGTSLYYDGSEINTSISLSGLKPKKKNIIS